MIKVLWFSNCMITDSFSHTGTWLKSMADLLIESKEVELYNITQKKVKETIRCDYKNVRQWVLPLYKKKLRALPSKKNIKKIQDIVNAIEPDIIHVWGMECYWGLLCSRKYVNYKAILEIQGMKQQYSNYFFKGLNAIERLKCIGLKEMINPLNSIFFQKQAFKMWGKYEKEMLSFFENISTQSNWVRANIICHINPATNIYNTKMPLREEFYNCPKWEYKKGNMSLLTISSGPTSYKGIHDLIKSIAILKRTFPNISLNIAGNFGHDNPRYKRAGYTNFLLSLIESLGLNDNIIFLGSLNARAIIKQMHGANVMVIPSYIETYCVSLAEAMQVGIPCVVTYTGAMSELAHDEHSALYYSPGDYVKCAYQINRLLSSSYLSNMISSNSIKIASIRNNKNNALKAQLAIYNRVIA